MAVDPMEEVAKRMQGLKDARGPVGQLARGNNVYNSTSQAAQSGPGGPDMGRPPTAVSPAAVQAVLQRTGVQPQQQAPQGSAMTANPVAEKAMAQTNRQMGGLAKAALQAAAKRKLQRSK